MKNINLISIFDCCRETKLKGKSMTAAEKRKLKAQGIVAEDETKSRGMHMTFYAKPDG